MPILQNHRCGSCELTFKTELQYIQHECQARQGFTPLDKQFLGEKFPKISEAALARGAARTTV